MAVDLIEPKSTRPSASTSLPDAETAVVGPSNGSNACDDARVDAGSTIGRYVVLEEVGRGGMGRVLRAYDPELDREVALKEVRKGVLGRDGAKRLVAEARAMAKLSHPNVVALYDVEESAPDRVVLVMEYVAGPTLSGWLKQRPRTWDEILARFREAGGGIAAAHAASLLHRDFKPSNVLVTDHVVKVTDFGLAKLAPVSGSISTDGDAPFAPSSTVHSSVEAPCAVADSDGAVELGAEALTDAGVVLGTPRYMAPEQHRGEALTPAVDQYAFCVALWEALCGSPPFNGRRLGKAKAQGPPRWPGGPTPRTVVDAVRRGLAPDPAHRWPSMQALLDALARDPGRRRTRSLLTAGGVVMIGVSAFAWHSWSSTRTQHCTEWGAAVHLSGAWDEARRKQVHDAILAVDASYADAVWERTEQALDAYAAEWTQMHVETCQATTVLGQQSTRVMDLRMACLKHANQELQAVTQVLAEADADVVQKAHDLVAGLRPLERCADVQALDFELEPPLPHEADAVEAIRGHLARARASSRAGDYDRARREVDEARARLIEVDYEPVQAEVALVEGRVLGRLGQNSEAEAVLRDALWLASRWRQREEMHSAATELVFVVGCRQQRFDEGLRYAELARGVATDDLELEAALDNHLASVRYAMGEYEEAEKLYERALAVQQKVLGSAHPDVAATLNNLSNTHYQRGDYQESTRLNERALAIRERALGPDHPEVAASLNNLANGHFARGAYDEATPLYERALSIREEALGPEHPDVAPSLSNLATIHWSKGHHARARELYARTLAILEKAFGPGHPTVAMALTNLANVHFATREYAEAAGFYRRALAIQENAEGPEHPDLALTLNNLAHVSYATGAYAEAAAAYERALAIQEKVLGPEHEILAYPLVGLALVALAQERPDDALPLAERSVKLRESVELPAIALAEARLVLAQALIGAGGPKLRAISLARQAADAYRVAGEAHREQLEEARAFLRQHG